MTEREAKAEAMRIAREALKLGCDLPVPIITMIKEAIQGANDGV